MLNPFSSEWEPQGSARVRFRQRRFLRDDFLAGEIF